MHVRTVFQPTLLHEVSEQEAAVLEHQGLLWTGDDDELAAHYRAAGLDVPPDVKPTTPAAAADTAPAAKTTTPSQAKGA